MILVCFNRNERVFKPKGILLIADPWAPTPFRQLVNIFMHFSKDGDVKIYSKPEIHKLLENTGFNDNEWKQITGENAFIVTASK